MLAVGGRAGEGKERAEQRVIRISQLPDPTGKPPSASPLSGNDMHEQLQGPFQSPTSRGVHHLALCTDDMKATIDFYVEVLGMPLVHAMKEPPGLGPAPANLGNRPYERVRHYFFHMANDSLPAFSNTPQPPKPPHNRHAISALH